MRLNVSRIHKGRLIDINRVGIGGEVKLASKLFWREQ
jgi:hypothetical protein